MQLQKLRDYLLSPDAGQLEPDKPTGLLGKQSRSAVIAEGLLLILLAGILDERPATGTLFSVLLFYLVPIALMSWYAGGRAGFIGAVFSAVTRCTVAVLRGRVYEYGLIGYGNLAAEIIFFFIFARMLSTVRSQLETEKRLARTDALTRIPNRRAFLELAELEIERTRRYGHPLSVAYIDLDNFKNVNDQWGHSVGDMLLQVVAGTIKINIRQLDVITRLGGDEFALLLPETGNKGMCIALHRLQEKLAEAMRNNNWPVTASIGGITLTTPPRSVDELLQKADSAMYAAKKSGKNCVYCEGIEDGIVEHGEVEQNKDKNKLEQSAQPV